MREVPNAITGVSPFVLQYGLQPKGVLSLIKDNWTGMENLPTCKPDIPMLNMLPHVIAEGMAPNIQVTIHSKVVHMMLDSGAQVSVLPSELAGEFDPPVPLPSRGVGDHGVQSGGSGYQSLPG